MAESGHTEDMDDELGGFATGLDDVLGCCVTLLLYGTVLTGLGFLIFKIVS